MAARFMGEKTPKQESIDQALRRLKYLHTSLAPHEGKTIQSGQNLDQILWTKGIRRPENEGRFTSPRRTMRTPEKQCFLSLQPKTVRKHKVDKVKARVAKYKQKRKTVCTGRAPLFSTYGIPDPQTLPNRQFEFNSNNVVTSRTETVERARNSKSASGLLRIVDPYKCVQCFGNDFEHTHKKQVTKQYCTNIRINRVTFSARPSDSNFKSLQGESRAKVSKGCLFNGWGARCKKDLKGNVKNSDLTSNTKDTIDVTADLKTLRLETRNDRMRQDFTERTIPQPPPTPVRQIDIKLPQGVVVKYHLSEDE